MGKEYEPLTIRYETISLDAEVNAIYIIPQILKDLTLERKLALLDYLRDRYKSGDTFGV